MRLVCDTNIIISALVFDRAPERLIVLALSRQHELVTSPYIINETNRVLKSKFHLRQHALWLYQTFMSTAQVVYFDPYLSVVDDEPDNRVLETAAIGKADCIVTGDKLLLNLAAYGDVQIITVAECLRRMTNAADES